MTPGELRSRAARLRAQAADLDADAVRLRGQAAGLRGLLDPLVGMSQRVWVGPAARDFESQVRVHGGIVDEQANHIERIADQLVQRARDARGEAQRLEMQAAAAEAATAAAAMAASTTSSSAAVPTTVQ